MRELESSLSDIEVIGGSLSIVRSYPLRSLGFFKKLRIISGKKDGGDRYGFSVIDNPNLEMLFHQNVTVKHGRMYIHFNPKLCMRIIEEFKHNVVVLRGVSELPANEVATDSNGDRTGCHVSKLNVTVATINQHAAEIMLKPLEYDDERNLLGYLFYYKLAPIRNVTLFAERDACETVGWQTVQVIDQYRNSSQLKIVLNDLKPNTQYACYIRTHTITSEQSSGQSPIHYFETLPYRSDVVTNLSVSANDSLEIVRCA